MNSFRLPPAASNAPPARLTATAISSDSTAKAADTLLIELNVDSKSLASILNCCINAIVASVVLLILPNVALTPVLAKASSATFVSFADKPA